MTKLVQDKRPDLINVIEMDTPKELGLIPTWSHSALKTYETCAYRSYISKVKKVQEDFGPATQREERLLAGTLDSRGPRQYPHQFDGGNR